MKTSDFLIQSLRAGGIDVCFGLPGVHALSLWDAVERSGIRYVGFRHEQAAAHAADGYGRATRKPGVVLLSTGPGALNALSAIGEAYVSSSPVIAIASGIPSNLVGLGKGFLHEAKDLLPAFEAVTNFAARATNPGDVPGLFRQAMSAAWGGRGRPVYLEIPANLFDEETGSAPFDPTPDPPASPEQPNIDEAAKLLGLAARPLIWAGGGVSSSGATEVLTRLAEKIAAPVLTTFMGKGAIPENHPLALGSIVRQPETTELTREADLLLAVGTRFSGPSTGNWKLALPSQLVHIDIDPEEPGRNFPVRLAIVGDANDALKGVLASLSASSQDSEWGAKKVKTTRATVRSRGEKQGQDEIGFIDAVSKWTRDGITTVHDMNVPSYWSWPFLEVHRPRSYFSPYGYGSLGFGLPAAIGVAAAEAPKPVIVFVGDGGFAYHSRELATLVEYNLPVKVIVFNDESWGVLKSFFRSRYDTTFGLDLPGPDLVELAGAYGVPSVRVEDPKALAKQLDQHVNEPGPALIEVKRKWALPPPASYYT